MNNEEELNEKLAKWAGFYQRLAHIYMGEKLKEPMPQWDSPDGHKNIVLPDFIKSLDNCYKWLVPKLEQRKLTIQNYSFKQKSGRFYAEYNIYEESTTAYGTPVLCGNRLAIDYQEGNDLGEISALALCKAIEKLIDSDEKA